MMAHCVKCGAETIMFVQGVPICVACDEIPGMKQRLTPPKPTAKEERKEAEIEKGRGEKN
jgi:hypothetical protein